MPVDRGRFLLFASTLAAGGAAGYLLSEKDVVPHLPSAGGPKPHDPAVAASPVPAPAPAATATASASAPVGSAAAPPPAVTTTSAITCDDSVGDAGACPPPGYPAAEGGCGSYAANRCADFKKAMKPRVAANAVACLNKLTPAERCDPKRVDLCAHLALMSSCEDKASTVESGCEAISRACGEAPIAPSPAECRLAMSGLREIGREALVDCAKAHCADKGILGCESAPIARAAK